MTKPKIPTCILPNGRKREYNNEKRQATARLRQHMLTMRLRLIDIEQFELIELRKQLQALEVVDEGTNAKRQEILAEMTRRSNEIDRLQRPDMPKRKQKKWAKPKVGQELVAVQREQRRFENREQRKKQSIEVRNQYKQAKRRSLLPISRLCPRCSIKRMQSAKWVIKKRTGKNTFVICKACWTKILAICRTYSIDIEEFLSWGQHKIASKMVLSELIDEFLSYKAGM